MLGQAIMLPHFVELAVWKRSELRIAELLRLEDIFGSG